MRKSSGRKGSATITRLSWEIEILERIEPGGGGGDSRVIHQNDARETGKAIPFRWRRGWERGRRSGWICVAMAEAQEDREPEEWQEEVKAKPEQGRVVWTETE